jgi:LEA14-like dessication related protein
MIRNFPIYLLFATLVATVSLSCSSPKELVYKDYHNFKIQTIGFTKSIINLDLEYHNPNNFGLQLRRTDLEVYINNNLLGRSYMDTLIRIPARASFMIPLKVDVDMKNIFKNALTTMFRDSVLVKVTGKLKVGKANVFMSFPVNYEAKHKFAMF